MNGLVNDLNANIKKVADALNQFGVFYVEPPNDAYAKHRFCEPAPKSYHESEVGKNTWFWHWDYPIGHNDEGPETYAFDAGSPDKDNFFNVSQAALDIFIPDKEKQKSLSVSRYIGAEKALPHPCCKQSVLLQQPVLLLKNPSNPQIACSISTRSSEIVANAHNSLGGQSRT